MSETNGSLEGDCKRLSSIETWQYECPSVPIRLYLYQRIDKLHSALDAEGNEMKGSLM
jgi:hypothetical protein